MKMESGRQRFLLTFMVKTTTVKMIMEMRATMVLHTQLMK